MAEVTTETISQDQLSAILSGKADSVIIPKETEEKVEEKEEKEEKSTAFKKPIDEDFKWTDLEKEIDEDDKTETGETSKVDGKKSEPFLSVLNDLITSGDLVGFEDGEIKSVDEAKELIRLNVQEAKKSGFEDVWKDKVESFSPQVQAILRYAETGGQDILPLLNAISKVEEVSNFDVETEEGQEEILKQYLKVQGWDEDDIKEEIETAKDLNKLKSKAEKFLPKLDQMHQQRVNQMMEEQAEADKEAEQARQTYLTTIRTTLSKDKLADIKLGREDKALLWDSLTDIKYKSWSGQPTNKFFKKLEEIQAGKTADYDHFLEIVHMTVDPKGYKEKLKEQLKTETTVETARKLKIDQKRNSNSETLFEEEQKKPTIQRSGFKNPFA
jgi:hypothetical protein